MKNYECFLKSNVYCVCIVLSFKHNRITQFKQRILTQPQTQFEALGNSVIN